MYESDEAVVRTDDMIKLTSTQIILVHNSVETVLYTYSGPNVFIGVSDTANSSIPCALVGDTFQIDESSAYQGMYGLILYIIDIPVTEYKKISVQNNSKVQVESAVRDGEGVKLSTIYAKKSYVDSLVGDLSSIMTALNINQGGE